jgi:hypothetical protein
LVDFFPPVDEVPLPTNLLLFDSTTGQTLAIDPNGPIDSGLNTKAKK